MSYVERSDEELLAFAREGVASAFAALLYRHGHEVLALAQQDQDPIGAVVATYVRAMRDLPNADPDDVRLWLLDYAAKEIDGEVEVPATAAAGATAAGANRPSSGLAGADNTAVSTANGTSHAATSASGRVDAPPMETDDELDEVWAELALRWPTGRAPRHLPSWVIWLITTVILVALAILLPWAVLGVSGEDEVIEELRASPVLDDLTFQEEVAEEGGEEEELPTFEFPDPPEDDDEPEPEPDTAPAPAPEPEPAQAPDPVEEPDDTTTDDDTDDGTEDDGDTTDEPDDDPDDEADTGGDDDDDDGDLNESPGDDDPGDDN